MQFIYYYNTFCYSFGSRVTHLNLVALVCGMRKSGQGSMLGGFLAGFVLDAVLNPHHVLVFLLVVKASAELMMPFSSSLDALAVNIGIIAACANAMIRSNNIYAVGFQNIYTAQGL